MQGKWTALACAATMALAVSPAHAAWLVKAQAHGQAGSSDFHELGSSDGSANQDTKDGLATGGVTYANGNTQIHASGAATNPLNTNQGTTSSVLSDLSAASIHYFSTQSDGAANSMYGELDDTLHFVLPDADSVYLVPFTYTFDGSVTGGFGMSANTFFILGFADAGSDQANGAGGPYQPPAFAINPGASWQDAALTPVGDYGYRVTGVLKVGGPDLGTNVAFQIRANIACGFDINTTQVCDFGNTQKFAFGALPSGVSFTSDSGVFLTAQPGSTPEPAAWALMIAGFGLAGASLRARGRARAAA